MDNEQLLQITDNEQLLQEREQICHQAERGYQGSAYHGSAYHSSSQTEEITRTPKQKLPRRCLLPSWRWYQSSHALILDDKCLCIFRYAGDAPPPPLPPGVMH